MKSLQLAPILMFFFNFCFAQSKIDSFRMLNDVKITLDIPQFNYKKTTLILYALPNGNTTAQTMGKKLQPGDDWHYDIQHIKAQTKFLREKLKENIMIAYLENDYKSWPSWKQKHHDYRREIPIIVDSIYNLVPSKNKTIYLNGHSGGGSFIFGYLDGLEKIPSTIKRISFIDSNYGYDSTYTPKFISWLNDKKATLTVFAYNDSIALYNGKPVVSEKGGTWYRSRLMMQNFQNDFSFHQTRNDSLIFYQSANKQVAFFFKTNPERKIYHTQQVELNDLFIPFCTEQKKKMKGTNILGKEPIQSS